MVYHRSLTSWMIKTESSNGIHLVQKTFYLLK
jgi:hypothetical protein